MRYVILLTAIVLAPSAAAAQTCQSLPGVVYASYVDSAGQTQNLLLDLLLPNDATSPTPVVVWIHGGGWRSGSRAPMPTRAANLCPRGYAVATIDYRLTGVARWPAQIQDVRAAVRWLRAHATQYNLDAGRVAAWGNSSGGHLAAMLAAAGGVKTATIGSVNVDLEGTVGGNLQYSSRVQAAVSWYPLTDFLQERFYPMNRDVEGSASYEGSLLGGKIQDRPELTATANPITYATSDDPPLLTMHGTADRVAPFNQSELLVDALLDAGVDARLYAVEGAQHTADSFDRTTHLNVVYAFFDRVLENPAVPPPPSSPPVSASGVRVEAIDRTGTEAGDPGRFRVTRGGDVANALTVTYTVSGTATHASDYSYLQHTITIPAGAASVTFDVVPLEDDLRESSETVIVTIAASSSYALGNPRTASVFIRDNDSVSTRPTVSLSATDREASESGSNTGAFMVTRTGSTTNPLTVSIETGGRAIPGVDYGSLPATVTFASGINRVMLRITPLSDSNTEGAEDVTLAVVPSASIYIGPYDRGFVSIADSVSSPPPPPPPLPTGWQSRDIGAVGVAGSATESGGVFTVRGGGADVWGTVDAFHFAYRSMSGDATIVARVASISGTQAWTKIGVMIRASTATNAAHAFMLVSVSKGLAFQRRTANGATSTHTSGGTGTAPRWVRLVRTGSTIVASVSTDGASWTEVGRDTFTMPDAVLIGLAAHSHDTSRLATGTFEQVAVR